MPNNDDMLDAEVLFSLKHLDIFRGSLDLPLINCEMEIDLSWSKECIIIKISITLATTGNPPTLVRQAARVTF